MVDTKKCSKCGQVKPYGFYSKDKRSKIGIQCACKDCNKKYSQKYYIKNKEHLIGSAKDYYKKNKIACREYAIKHYEENKESILKQQKEYRKTDEGRAVTANTVRKYQQDNKDRIKSHRRKWVEKNRAAINRRDVIKNDNHKLNITDKYVKDLIRANSSIKPTCIPQSLIDLKRLQIQIQRKLKEAQ